jgi:hypothetical protein
MTAKKLNCRQARWSLYLARFDFHLHHRPGRSMGKPDALSRRADHGTGANYNQNITFLPSGLFAVCALEGISVDGEEQQLLKDIRQGNRTGAQEEAVAKATRELKQSATKTVRSTEWSEQEGLLMFRGKIYVPDISDLRRRIVNLHHDTKISGHAG